MRKKGFKFIDNKNVDNSCLKGSNLHLNSKGSALLAANFIKFIRGKDVQPHYLPSKNKGFSSSIPTTTSIREPSQYIHTARSKQSESKEVSAACDHGCDPIQDSNQGNPLNILKNLKGLKIASLNINSIIKHIDELQVLLESNPIDIQPIHESKIDDTVSDNEWL